MHYCYTLIRFIFQRIIFLILFSPFANMLMGGLISDVGIYLSCMIFCYFLIFAKKIPILVNSLFGW